MAGTIAVGPQGGEPSAGASSGVLAAVGCYTLWGLLPILFIQAGSAGAGAFEIVAWRTIWSLPCAGLLVAAAGHAAQLRRLARASWLALVLSSALLAVNWSVYVWAVEAGRTISASLGYYILPLLNVAAGAVLFKERISRTEQVALALATVGVLLQGLALAEIPWVSIVLAFSFCGYGVVRKRAAVPADVGLLGECLVLVAPAVLYAVWLGRTGHATFGTGPGHLAPDAVRAGDDDPPGPVRLRRRTPAALAHGLPPVHLAHAAVRHRRRVRRAAHSPAHGVVRLHLGRRADLRSPPLAQEPPRGEPAGPSGRRRVS